jgi:GDPmannose 4,6-dehydratase
VTDAPAAFVTGLSGQDGSYLAELLLDKGYVVHGLVRDGRWGSAAHLSDRVVAHDGDLRDGVSLEAAVSAAAPREIYHLAAVTSPGKSWDDAAGTFDVVTTGTVRLLDTVVRRAPQARILLAASAEVFGEPASAPQDEDTPLRPRNPYGAAKAAVIAAAEAYRRGRGLFASVGIFYNHESPRRPVDFVTRKVTWHAAAIARGDADVLRLGNLDARRDWGYAPDYMRGAWAALQAEAPSDYVFATGELHSVRELVDVAFARAGVPVDDHVEVAEEFVRPEPDVPLVGDPGRAERELGWRAETRFDAVVAEMVDHDMAAAA